MDDYDAETYGDRIAEHYDDLYGGLFDTDGAVARLAGLAGEGRALELGIGTGRIALPLSRAGVDVYGIDSSEAMVRKLREKPGGDRIGVTLGDFKDVAVDGSYRVIFVAFNTFFSLDSQDDQIECLRNAAARLTDDGVFVMEGFVPDPARFEQHQRVAATRVDLDAVLLEVSRHDPIGQLVHGQQIVVSEKGVRLFPVVLRYAWPAELDLMARLAGLRLRDRWGGWREEPFTSSSTSHVSVYERQ